MASLRSHSDISRFSKELGNGVFFSMSNMNSIADRDSVNGDDSKIDQELKMLKKRASKRNKFYKGVALGFGTPHSNSAQNLH